MAPVRLILMMLAILCFLLAAIGVVTPRGSNLTAAGLALWALAATIG